MASPTPQQAWEGVVSYYNASLFPRFASVREMRDTLRRIAAHYDTSAREVEQQAVFASRSSQDRMRHDLALRMTGHLDDLVLLLAGQRDYYAGQELEPGEPAALVSDAPNWTVVRVERLRARELYFRLQRRLLPAYTRAVAALRGLVSALARLRDALDRGTPRHREAVASIRRVTALRERLLGTLTAPQLALLDPNTGAADFRTASA
jgi:hypothetical protein